MKTLRIGTRASKLALWQARHVAQLLAGLRPELTIELCEISTEADRRTNVALTAIGGKNLFVKELEQALSDRRVDIAVHSMKDVTASLQPQFDIPVILEREDPRDAFVSNAFASIQDLPENATLGTCSPRRQSQMLALRRDLAVVQLRGNVQTRLARLDEGGFDATILAVSGLRRLDLESRITEFLSVSLHVPSPGQGALGIECRSDDDAVRELIAPLNHPPTRTEVEAERHVNRRLGGNCHMPLGTYAKIRDGHIEIQAYVGLPDGSRRIVETEAGRASESGQVADALADTLIARGSLEVLETCEQLLKG